MTLKRVLAAAVVCGMGCGSSKDAKAGDAGSGLDAATPGADGSIDAAVDEAPRLDPGATAEQAAEALCSLAPWVLGSVGETQLPAKKITNVVRDDVEMFILDKPPICIDDKDSGEDLCDEMPSSTTTYAFLFRGEAGKASDPVQQVWCKSDNYQDLALIEGIGETKKGSCETLHGLVVAWAMAQPDVKASRSIRYEPEVLERGSMWAQAMVVTSEEGDVLVARSPELYADTKKIYIEQNGTDALPFIDDDFFGNHYCKLLSPAAALAWLQGI